MNKKKLVIVSLIIVALACLIVVILSEFRYIFSQSRNVISVSEESSTGYVFTGPATLPPLTSHEEAVNLTDKLLKEMLGYEFFQNHFTLVRVDEEPDSFYDWVVVYNYFSNGYTVEMRITVNWRQISEYYPRIDIRSSRMILYPQEILITEDEAKQITKEYGITPPYTMILSCELEFYRICWRITKKGVEELNRGELAGIIIDAENGIVLYAWERGYRQVLTL